MRRVSLLSLFAILLAACTSIDCPVQNTVSTVYALRKGGGMAADTLRDDTLTVFTARADGSDSIILNKLTLASSFELPVSHTAPEDTLVFLMKTRHGDYRDVVHVTKDNLPHFESVDCNISFFHTITGVRWTGNAIDSIVINKRDVTYDNSTAHFHIYFKAGI